MSWARVAAGSRWDAVALLDALPDVRGYLVQTDECHWTLHVECDRGERDLLTELLRGIADWLTRRSLAATVIEIAGSEQPIHAGDDARENEQVARTLLGGSVPEQVSGGLPLLEHEIAGLLQSAARPGRRTAVR